jgi:(1->4)-alpha-D-glucan 1-alpha-D-glucosylmutase
MNKNRLENEPTALSASSTHDTKRSEDVRARINVLSEISSEWISRVEKWMKLNRKARIRGQSDWIPEPSLEFFIYQTLLGAWPLLKKDEGPFRERLLNYAVKAARERKRHSDWITPDSVYEESLQAFISGILREDRLNHFLADFRVFARRIALGGAVNSISQTMIKILSPGIPDFYQGTELWDFSLVDPDNRRPVDYRLREELLNGLQDRLDGSPSGLFRETLSGWEDGRIKLFVIHTLLRLRKTFPDLFVSGGYHPLLEDWERSEHMMGFARILGDQAVLLCVPQKPLATIDGQSDLTVSPEIWGDRRMPLPLGISGPLTNVFSGRQVPVVKEGDSGMDGEFSVRMSDAFGEALFTVLVSRSKSFEGTGEDGATTGSEVFKKERGGGGGVR